MALPDGLLNPIAGENPSGKNLRYDPILDKIREARREEEVLPQGAWAREVKKADFPQVIKLATEALSTKTKDLQIAAWLTEAIIYRDRVAGLREGLELLRGMMENFWDTLYPEIEDGDLELRIGPIEWVATRLDAAVRKVPLTKNKLDWFKFQESRKIGYEAEAQGNDAKMAARQEAIAEKKCTAEEFDEAARLTGTAYYQQLAGDLAAAVTSIDALEALSDEKFGRDAPSFKNLRLAIEDLQTAVKQYYNPEAETADEEASAQEEDGESAEAPEETAAGGGAPAKGKKKKAVSEEPADREDAVQRLVRLAEFLRKENSRNPVPYLILRSVRWGEIREAGSYLNAAMLEAPPTELRQQVKKFSMEGQWNELIEAAETCMGMTCGRGWLDLQRQVVRACENLGSDYEPAAAGIRGTLRALLTDYPDLINATLMDDTPAANAETQAWLREAIVPPPPEPPATPAEPEPIPEPVMQSTPASGQAAPDVHELAMKAAKSGKVQEAIEMLMREIAQEKSGRARFQRKIQLATLCLSTKHEAIAYPILAELAEEIDRRRLEEWEEATVVAHPLALLYRCLDKMGDNEAEKQKIYQKLCRLDPAQALACTR
jgi:type VI secretion system protein ImpA